MTTSTRHHRGGNGVVLDKPVVVALVSLAFVYSLITVVTYRHVAASDHVQMATMSSTPLLVLGNNNNIAVAADGTNLLDALQHSFPLHVNDETMETIQHPGAPYVRKQLWPTGLNLDTLRVPMFFDRAYGFVYGRERIRDFLGERGSRLITPQEAAAIGSVDAAGRETIYASVASYRDPECAGTVTDLYERAEYPERIRVAIVEQRLNDDSVCTTPPDGTCATNPDQALCKYRHLIDYFEMDAHFGVGPVFARHLAHRHYRGGEDDPFSVGVHVFMWMRSWVDLS